MDENTVAVGKDIDLETVILQNVDLVENIGAFKEVAEQFPAADDDVQLCHQGGADEVRGAQ